ncbi:DNA mismatch repair protein Mlh1 [Sarcoptes scabiei]|nr:DNA mismatch repair protein Mlh1 [Sarcoptes scabiei]
MEQKIRYNLINRLDQQIINKISAGEVIHRPMNVIKELMENSLDAGATNIQVTVKNGGMKQIIIQDNGCGINKEDMEIVCERFTTSKLTTMSDFETLNTFGFRGEALSSVSIVSKMSIISKTTDSICGYKAEYMEGHLIKNSLKPIAANDGTIIEVEDLFYNMPLRSKTISSESHELSLIQDLISKFAIIFSNKCGFILKKYGDNCQMINTKSSDTLLSNIDRLFGQSISSKLIAFDMDNPKLNYKVNGYFSNNDLNLKKFHFILSINSRLVECVNLRKSLKELFKNFLMKSGNPFILIFMQIDPKNIDVNLHPTKNEVKFLYDEEIIARIVEVIKEKLQNKPKNELDFNLSQDFQMNRISNENKSLNNFDLSIESKKSEKEFGQKLQKYQMENFFQSTPKMKALSNQSNEKTSSSSTKKSNKIIRIDSKQQRLDHYVNQRCSSNNRRSIELLSLSELRVEIGSNVDEVLLKIISESCFVGCVDKNYLLFQHQLDLYLLKLADFNQELFYQIFLLDFGNFNYLRFKTSLSLRMLLETYFEVYPDLKSSTNSVDEMIEMIISKQTLLEDYFSISLNDVEESLEALPVLIDQHQPNIFTCLSSFIESSIKSNGPMRSFASKALEKN